MEKLIHTHQEVVKMEEDILSHRETPKTILQLQMVLAEELYEADHEGEKIKFDTRENRNAILEYWAKSGYSILFRTLVDGKEKINENPMEITLDELRRMKEEELRIRN